MSDIKKTWWEAWNAKPHHALTVAEFVGPFPVGPVGYRRTLADRITAGAGQVAEWAAETNPVLPNPHRPDLVFHGNLWRGNVYALDAETRQGLACLDRGSLGVITTRRAEGIPEEMYWLISEGRRNGDPAVRTTMDYSLGGFKARVRGHALILNRMEDKSLIPPEVMADYAMAEDGLLVLSRNYTPEAHNAFWGVDYNPRFVEAAEDTPRP